MSCMGIIRNALLYIELYVGAIILKFSKMALNPFCNESLHMFCASAQIQLNMCTVRVDRS